MDEYIDAWIDTWMDAFIDGVPYYQHDAIYSSCAASSHWLNSPVNHPDYSAISMLMSMLMMYVNECVD